jgi:hypothetical protein
LQSRVGVREEGILIPHHKILVISFEKAIVEGHDGVYLTDRRARRLIVLSS